jgi:hypothetical protein
MAALRLVRREPFWDQHLRSHTIYVFPDLTGTNRYRGYTQEGTHTDDAGRRRSVFIIHISQDMLNNRQTELVATNLVHELAHTINEPTTLDRAMETFQGDLAELLADHPQVQAARASAADATAARQEHVSRIRQLLHDASSYAEGEILSLLQQLTHQPSMTIDGAAVSGTHFVLDLVTAYVRQLARIGLPRTMLGGLIGSIRRRTEALYDRRIAAAPAGSQARRVLAADKALALSTLGLAVSEASNP